MGGKTAQGKGRDTTAKDNGLADTIINASADNTNETGETKEKLKCEYDSIGYKACFNCPYPDCIRNDIRHDGVFIPERNMTKRERYRESYERADKRWKRKRLGLYVEPIVYKRKGREAEYQREYRANMSDEQRQTYRDRQRKAPSSR